MISYRNLAIRVQTITAFSHLVLGFLLASSTPQSFAQDEASNESKIKFVTRAENWIVDIDTSIAEEDCKGFKSVGALFYDAQLRGGGFFGALQKLNPIKPDEKLEINQAAISGSNLQVKARATTSGAVNASCGPLTARFAVEKNKSYEVDIQLDKGVCRLAITDASIPDSKVLISPIKSNYCN